MSKQLIKHVQPYVFSFNRLGFEFCLPARFDGLTARRADEAGVMSFELILNPRSL
jgi:hypothetical protein